MKAHFPTLLHQYASLHPPSHLSLPPSGPSVNLDLARNQAWIVDHLVGHERLQRYPPAGDYQRAFWKLIVGRLEDGCRSKEAEEEELEVHEEIYEAYLNNLSATSSNVDSSPFSSSAPPGTSYKTFFFPLPPLPSTTPHALPASIYPEAVTLREEQKTIQAGTTGLRTWGASLRLAELFLERPTLLPDGEGGVLELGSGVGFLGLVLGKLREGRGQVVMTDFDERVLAALRENVEINNFPPKEVRVEALNWEDSLDIDSPSSLDVASFGNPNLLVAADVVYDPSIIGPLVSTLRLFLSSASVLEEVGSRPKTAIVASTIRNQTTFDAFVVQAVSQGLKVEEVDQSGVQRIFWGAEEGGTNDLTVKILLFTSI